MASFRHYKTLLKRWTLLLLPLTLGLILFLQGYQPGLSQSAYPAIRGVWITNNDTIHFMDQGRTQESINQLARLNFNTLYPVVWNSGYILYESAIAKREGLQPFSPRGDQGQDVLADLIQRAHRQGLLVLPWFEFGFMAPPFSELVRKHPQWFTQRQDGSKTSVTAAGEVMWMNPFHPQVQKFITDLVLEVVTQYDVDGIQFDDHTALPNQFGYDPYTVALYQQEMKTAPPSNPKDPAWIRWRADKLTAFIAQLNQAIKARKPQILFSLSPATYNLAYQTYLQDWLDWVRKGLVDEVIVQVYRTQLASFIEPLQRPEFQEAKLRVPTAVGVLTGLKTKQVPMALVAEKVRAAMNQGLGIAFFYYKTLWEIAPEDKQSRLSQFQALFRSPAPRSLAQKFVPQLPPIPLAPSSATDKSSTPAPRSPQAPKNPVTTKSPRPTVVSPQPPRDNFPPEPTLTVPVIPAPSTGASSIKPAPQPVDNFPPEPTLDPEVSPLLF
ncbi:family 10 glycosylhydrolase [Synechocystis sp. LKSZ1]|uniref:family 10 glycosylhydrolase n=1 Tax=Synechocystis sp. LKSZ1 TaxID=3144951 RepID=UPI00336C27A0